MSLTGTCHEASAQEFGQHFEDATLRLDYTFAGNDKSQAIYLDRMKSFKGWYGRRINMNTLPLQGEWHNHCHGHYRFGHHLHAQLLHSLPGMAEYRRGYTSRKKF